MRHHKIALYCLLVFTIFLTACQDDKLPSNPVLMAPVSGLVINVNGENYTALPVLKENGSFDDTYILPVKIPSKNAKIVQINFTDKSLSSDLKVGDEVQFDADNKLALNVLRDGTTVAKYWVEMRFNPPAFFYFIKTSDKDADGNRYFLDLEHPQTIASGTYDEWFEGYVDLTMSNWDNIGLISSDLTTVYDYEGGPWPPLTEYAWNAAPHVAPGTGCYPVAGPWNDWKVTNDNPDIVSPGVWRISFNSTTLAVNMTETQWCVDGSSVDKITPMIYDSSTRMWSVELSLSAGSFRFKTTPVTFGDQTFDFGLATSGISELAEGGKDIEVKEVGKYRIELCLSNSPYYTYKISKI